VKRLWPRFLAFAVIFAILMTVAFLLGLARIRSFRKICGAYWVLPKGSSGLWLVWVGSRGSGAIKRVVTDSVSEGVASNAHCSVMVACEDEGRA
jgi:Universal stress protein family